MGSGYQDDGESRAPDFSVQIAVMTIGRGASSQQAAAVRAVLYTNLLRHSRREGPFPATTSACRISTGTRGDIYYAVGVKMSSQTGRAWKFAKAVRGRSALSSNIYVASGGVSVGVMMCGTLEHEVEYRV
jgi:hypothetical protein